MKNQNLVFICIMAVLFNIQISEILAQKSTITATVFNSISNNPIFGKNLAVIGVDKTAKSSETGEYSNCR
jgi:hypothetical protein